MCLKDFCGVVHCHWNDRASGFAGDLETSFMEWKELQFVCICVSCTFREDTDGDAGFYFFDRGQDSLQSLLNIFSVEEQAMQIAHPVGKKRVAFHFFLGNVTGADRAAAVAEPQAAALAVAESPGDTYNPLFIYGGAGLGKTHLMHSIAHYIIEHDENSKVLYVTSEEFTNELIETIRNGNNSAMSKFREKYRNIDVLLVDDIQFIIGKESTQEEFFHTFNSLHSAKKQIIISSDKPPKDMEILEERFRSRFEWGLIADITLPDYETRMAILHKKEEMEGYNISEEVIKYIATNIKSNIRELEGAFNKVMASSKLEKKEVTLELAEQALKDIISPNEQKVITPDYIISVVAEHYHVTVADLCGNKRSSKIVMPRQIAMYLCRDIIDTSLKTIGKNLGDRDHTTVMHGIEKIENELKVNDNLRNSIDTLKKKINPQG